MSDVKIKVIDSQRLINAINEGSYEVNLSVIMALGAVMSDKFEDAVNECADRKPKSDMVNHPPHYQGGNGVEVIDVIESGIGELSGEMAYYVGNIIKYALRWPKKGGEEDIRKIIWYANRAKEEIILNMPIGKTLEEEPGPMTNLDVYNEIIVNFTNNFPNVTTMELSAKIVATCYYVNRYRTVKQFEHIIDLCTELLSALSREGAANEN